MGRFLIAAGRFRMEWLLAAAFREGRQLSTDEQLSGDWGLAYCHGNRLELVRADGRKAGTGVLKALLEIKTDMAVVYQQPPEAMAVLPGRSQPYSRYDRGTNWVFCYAGKISQPERLFPGWHQTPGGLIKGELLFAYVYDRFDVNAPVASLNEIVDGLGEEPELAFCLMSPELVAVACHTDGRADNPARLWLGRGELLRVVGSGAVADLPGISWELVPAQQVIFIQRQRWAVI
ncbi:MAG: hypothetical protein ACP5PK_04710 [candidate division WOR-3 bacterium]